MDSFEGSHVEDVVRCLLGQPNAALSSATELRYGTRGSLAVDLRKGTWFDHENNCGGGLVDLRCKVSGGNRKEAADWLKSQGIALPEHASHKPRIVKAYDYRNEAGKLIFQVVRYEPKSFRQRRPDGKSGWIWSTKGCRRLLYRLPELIAANPDAPVFLVEGEKDADRLASLGLVATTNPGGANKWSGAYAPTLHGRKVVLVADNDPAGEDHARSILASLTNSARQVVWLRFPDLPPKGDVSDWLDNGGDLVALETMAREALTKADVADLTAAKAAPTPNETQLENADRQLASSLDGPIPLLRPVDVAEPVPYEHLGPLRSTVLAISTLTQAPDAIGLQSVLGAASIAVQGHVDVETLAGAVPTSLLLFTIAESGERKSQCDSLALFPIRETDRARLKVYERDLKKYARASEDYHDSRKAISKIKNATEREVDLNSMEAPPQEPLSPQIIIGDATFEGLMRHLVHGQPSIGVFSDEGGQMLGGHAMNADNKVKTSAAYSKFWDGKEIDRTRASGPSVRLYGRRVSCHLMAQPMMSAKFLGDPAVRDQGLLSRALIVWPKSRIGFRIEPPDSDQDEAKKELEAYNRRITKLLDIALPVGDDPRELEPRVLKLSAGARQILSAFNSTVERAQRPGGPCEGIRGVASKAAQQAARIAGVMTLYENSDAQEVAPEIMAAATGLTDWYLREARRLLDTGPVKEKTERAELLCRWITEHWDKDNIGVRDATRYGPNSLRDATELKALFAMLEEFGWLVRLAEEGRKKLWRIVRS